MQKSRLTTAFFRYDKNRENLIISSSKIHQQAQEP